MTGVFVLFLSTSEPPRIHGATAATAQGRFGLAPRSLAGRVLVSRRSPVAASSLHPA